jgi:enamine deaminase RidA (YjgF/YER057c/UK114 family)
VRKEISPCTSLADGKHWYLVRQHHSPPWRTANPGTSHIWRLGRTTAPGARDRVAENVVSNRQLRAGSPDGKPGFLSGVGPLRPDGTFATGKVGATVSIEDAYQQARLTGLILLSALRVTVDSLDSVTRVVKVFGMVNSSPDFTDQPKVINGCSDLFVEVFGELGRHACSAVGMASLPFGISVEIEAIFEVS